MKYKIATFFCVVGFYNAIFGLNDYTNQTYMFCRPVFDSIAINQATWSYLINDKQTNNSAFQAYPIISTSIDNPNSSKYFLFGYKKELTVAAGTSSSNFTTTGIPKPTTLSQGAYTVETFSRDILGQWLGITNTNGASFSLQPKQTQIATMFEYHQDLKTFIKSKFVQDMSISIAAPLTMVENNIGYSGYSAVAKAFTQSNFQYAKISTHDITSVALSQVQIALNTQYLKNDESHIISSTGVIIPLTNQNHNSYLFEPVQGFNSHFVLNSAAFFQFPVYKKSPDASSSILFFLNINNNFLCRNHQLRTFDIKNKPYSRYLTLLDRYTNSPVPAMNVLTLRTRVEPFNAFNLAAGFRVKNNNLTMSLGYELWAHGTEVITPEPQQQEYGYQARRDNQSGNWNDDRYGIAFINENGNLAYLDNTGAVKPLPTNQPGLTASESTINYVASPNGTLSCCGATSTFTQTNKYLKLNDLDKFSCAAQATMIHKAFISLGREEKGKTRDMFANIGFSIELAQNNASLGTWTGWIKVGLTF